MSPRTPDPNAECETDASVSMMDSPLPLYRGKLTRRRLLNLLPGTFLVVPWGGRLRQYRIAEEVSSASLLDGQWRHIRAANADQRECFVFADRDAFLHSALATDCDPLVIAWQKLTRQFFDSLPRGVFVVSSSCFNTWTPHFAEQTVASDHRAEQWLRARELRAAGRNCIVFASESDYWVWRHWFVRLQNILNFQS